MFRKILIAAVILFSARSAGAQTAAGLKTYRVALFSPLYLDSVFEGNSYRYSKNFPRFTQQGLDFIQGAEIALDSIPLTGGNIQASIFDSKADEQDISWLLSNHKLDSMDLLIGSVKDSDFIQLAAFARQKNIPFVSATSPNDGGAAANPFLIIINSTLRAHCENIFTYLLQNHGTDNIVLCRRKGSQEDKIAAYFKMINEADGKPLLSMKVMSVEDDFSELKNRLDSTKHNVIIGGSLNEDFADALVPAAYALKKKYNVELVGMPNWDGFAEIRKDAYKDFPIIYTTTYCNARSDAYSRMVQNVYLKKYKGNPSDMSYKGFECMMTFAGLITKYPNDFISHLNDPAAKGFSSYNFKPVYLSKKSSVPDYFENKHLFFMKIWNGKAVKLM